MDQINTKQKIFYAAAELFSDKGYDNVSVRDIAKKVGIKAASIYNHYASKDDILNDILDFYYNITTRLQTERDEATLNQPIKDAFKTLHPDYRPEEMLLMYWITKIVFTEQFRVPRAANLIVGDAYKQYVNSYFRFFEYFREKGVFKADLSRQYSEILARISMFFMLQFEHPDLYDAKTLSAEMIVLYELVLDIAMKYNPE